ncbi:MAG: hypothetical protein F4058_04860 [Rhodothermaceae bacterium]|nr:hypothetical protein [Rhodothermaceae bacterium]MYF62878.1 hypothetical protein [Rhodothermaceae bacterium]MYI84651.1 hypothetical protein [Rhodothermaceae bacterium]
MKQCLYETYFILCDRSFPRPIGPWETEVWCADAPAHLVHFSGMRFLGLYQTFEI